MEKEVKKQEVDLTDLRNKICVPIAHEVLRIVARSKPLLGDDPKELFEEAYLPIKNKILQLYLEKELPVGHIEYVKQLVLQAFDWTFNMVNASMNDNLRRLQVKSFGKEVQELTVKELDDKLKT